MRSETRFKNENSSKSTKSQGPAQDVPATLQKIFSNLGPPLHAYNPNDVTPLAGPNSIYGYEQFVALPFTPAANAHVKQMRAALDYAGGANQVNLSLYSDAGGVPGALLAGPITVTGISSGGCCQLAIADLTAPVAVTAGVQYWMVADTPTSGTGSDFYGGWFPVVPPNKVWALNSGSGWIAEMILVIDPAGAVYGSIP